MLINEMVVFYYVVHLQSFSKAAEELEVSKSFVSKNITRLEKDLKTRLLNRSTRRLALTEAGELFYQHCQKLLELAEHGYEVLANFRNEPSGVLKISAPTALGTYLLSACLIEFTQTYPQIKLNILLESQIVDLIQQGYDLAIRSAVLPDSNLIAQKIWTIRNVLCASPKFLQSNNIKHPDQLKDQLFAIYGSNKSVLQLNLVGTKKYSNITVDSYFRSNNLDLIAQMTINGRCLTVLPEFMIKTALAKKELVVCLPKYTLPISDLYAVYPAMKYMPLKVKVFIAMLKKHLTNY